MDMPVAKADQWQSPGRVREIHAATFARHDPGHCLADGLWRPACRGRSKALRDTNGERIDARPAFAAMHREGDGTVVRFEGAHQPDDGDALILSVLLALAAKHDRGLVVTGSEASTESGQRLVAALGARGTAVAQDKLYITTTRAELTREAGLAWSGRQGDGVLDSLRRMAAVTVRYTRGKVELGGFSMLPYQIDNATGKIDVMLNPAIAATALGNRRPYALVELAEMRKLRKPAARILYQRLCATIDTSKNKGGTGVVGLGKLTRYSFSDDPNTKPGTLRAHRSRTRDALAEITSKTQWRAWESSRGIFTIRRPSVQEVRDWAARGAPDARGNPEV